MAQNTKTYNFDASSERLGRLASKVAQILKGKNEVDFEPHKNPDIKVLVKNISKIKLSSPFKKTKVQYYHTNYPGGLREISFKTMGPKKALQLAVLRMLSKNRLRAKLMKNLVIED